jgi:succinyl-CoA synthetase alpha subunit
MTPAAVLSSVLSQLLRPRCPGTGLIVRITEHIPQHDMIRVKDALKRAGVQLIGRNCLSIIQPRTHVKLSIIPTSIHSPGKIGIVSRSGTLT